MMVIVGFEVTLYGRFWVTPEEQGARAGAAPAYLSEGSGGLEKVSIDAQFPYFRFQCLPRNAQLGGGAGWTADYALGFLECGLDNFSFALDKVGNQRNSHHS